MDDREFRSALSSFATGVTVVTAVGGEHGPVGMTASSFNSVSMQPPLVLWSVTKATASADQFRDAQYYAIHVLGSDQQALAMQFATAGIDKFAGVSFQQDDHGVPLLTDCVTRFDCRQWAVYEGGDHWIIVCQVVGLYRANKETLVFCEGAFGTVNPIRTSDERDAVTSGIDSPVDRLLLYHLSRATHQMTQQFHRSVRDSGLSIPQWRILASLFGCARRESPDLQARTFLDHDALQDALTMLVREELCCIENNGATVVGTAKGHERVRHLFELGRAQELEAADEHTLESLIEQLSLVVKNTNHL